MNEQQKAIAEIVRGHMCDIGYGRDAPAESIGPHIHATGFVRRLADYFAQGDPEFDRAGFVAACNGKATKAHRGG